MLSIIGHSSVAYAEPKISFKNKIYKVRGSSIKDIKNSIGNSRKNSTNNADNFDASTKYSMTWKYYLKADAYGCKAQQADVSISITHEMPHLVTANMLSSEDRDNWYSYYKSLMNHELGHAELGIAAANEIEWEINNMLPQQNCDMVVAYIEKTAKNIIEKYDNQNIVYDSVTDHGVRQGAVLLAAR